jgi:uridylate kinase
MKMPMPYKRLLLKLSGEILTSREPHRQSPFSIDSKACVKVAQAIKALFQLGFEISVVIGGGNFFRGINFEEQALERTRADHIGMLATIMNGIALQSALAGVDCPATVMSALDCPEVVEPYRWERARELLAEQRCVIFVGGTGNPYFSTDTAAALRASEMNADLLLKATKVDGVYSQDPYKYADAVYYPEISYSQMLAEKLAVMDATAIALCQKNAIPILVFNMQALFDGQQMVALLSHTREEGIKGTLVHGQ